MAVETESEHEIKVGKVMNKLTTLSMDFERFIAAAKDISDEITYLQGTKYSDEFKAYVLGLERSMNDLQEHVEGVLPIY